jgi:hypothetical protein
LSQIEEDVHMLNLSQISLYCLALLAVAVAARAATSSAENNLLRLVPGGAQIVSGIRDPGRSSATGPLLVVTKNNHHDLDDCAYHLEKGRLLANSTVASSISVPIQPRQV